MMSRWEHHHTRDKKRERGVKDQSVCRERPFQSLFLRKSGRDMGRGRNVEIMTSGRGPAVKLETGGTWREEGCREGSG